MNCVYYKNTFKTDELSILSFHLLRTQNLCDRPLSSRFFAPPMRDLITLIFFAPQKEMESRNPSIDLRSQGQKFVEIESKEIRFVTQTSMLSSPAFFSNSSVLILVISVVSKVFFFCIYF